VAMPAHPQKPALLTAGAEPGGRYAHLGKQVPSRLAAHVGCARPGFGAAIGPLRTPVLHGEAAAFSARLEEAEPARGAPAPAATAAVRQAVARQWRTPCVRSVGDVGCRVPRPVRTRGRSCARCMLCRERATRRQGATLARVPGRRIWRRRAAAVRPGRPWPGGSGPQVCPHRVPGLPSCTSRRTAVVARGPARRKGTSRRTGGWGRSGEEDGGRAQTT
jgi:hypothetical protein